MSSEAFNQELISFLNDSPTPFHATANMASILVSHGFAELKEEDAWETSPGKYFVRRNQSSIIAFNLGTEPLATSGIRLVGAHTDSPCLKVKPKPEKLSLSYFQLGVEVYGGVLLNPWFDRDLAIAGRVTCRTNSGEVCSELIDSKRPLATIPSLAIHLDREVNQSRSVNPQTDIPPILMQSLDASFNDLLAGYLVEHADDEILASEIFFYDTNPAAIIGENNEFLAGARLDNLLSCFTGLMSMINSDPALSSLLICSDHEEVGSTSAAGAAGPFLKDTLKRLIGDDETRYRTLSRSMLISTDTAHGVHPNYQAKHDSNHGPILNQGPAIKYNANQRYATNSDTAGFFKTLCTDVQVPYQEFVNRTDMACGSTIGPITAGELGVRTLDVGVPTFGMHSIRELAGAADAYYLHQILTRFYQTARLY